MIIGIIGQIQSANFLAMKLKSYPEVEKIYAFHVASYTKEKKKTADIEKTEIVYLDDVKFVDSIKTCDIIFSMGLNLQTKPKLQSLLKKLSIESIVLVPSAECSYYEDSKIKSKEMFSQAGVRSPFYKVLPYNDLIEQFMSIERPFVLKYNTDFRYGRQTLIVNDANAADIFDEVKTYGKNKLNSEEANDFFIVEQYVTGKEHSLHILTDGTDWCYLGSARDYKKEKDNDQGNNVTSMGCYSPAGNLSNDVKTYVDNILSYFNNQGIPYRGILYLGVLTDNSGQDYILELNARPGNPEFITILDMIDENLVDLFMLKNLNKRTVKFKDGASVALQFQNNSDIYSELLDEQLDLSDLPYGIVGCYSDGVGHFPSSTIVHYGKDRQTAAETIYGYLENKNFKNIHYRNDIGRLD